jgi:hypothetical protein
MTRLPEMLKDADFRRPMLLSAASLLVWVIFAAFVWAADSSGNLTGSDITSSGRVLDYAIQFRALPRTGITRADAPDEPLGALSDIVDALGLRERMRQLQSNPSGIVVQIENMYGDELGDFLVSVEKGGLVIKTAEIRVLPGENGRMLGATLTMEGAK